MQPQPLAEAAHWYDSDIKGFDFNDSGTKGGISFWDEPTADKIAILSGRSGGSFRGDRGGGGGGGATATAAAAAAAAITTMQTPVSVMAQQPQDKEKMKCSECSTELSESDSYYLDFLPYCRACRQEAGRAPEQPPVAMSTVDRIDWILRHRIQYRTPLVDELQHPIFRTINGKRQLLSRAVESRCGHSVTAAILFLRRTLKPSVFKEELCRSELKGQAVLHYLAYLKSCEDFEVYKDTLLSFVPAASGQPPDVDAVAAMNFQRAVQNSDPRTRLGAVQRFIRSEASASQHLLETANACLQLLKQQQELDTRVKEFIDSGSSRYPLQIHVCFASLTVAEYLTAVCMSEQDLSRLSAKTAENQLALAAPFLAQATDQLAWCRIVALTSRIRHSETNEKQRIDLCQQLERTLFEKSGVLQRQQKPVLSWPVQRQTNYLKELGVGQQLLQRLAKTA